MIMPGKKSYVRPPLALVGNSGPPRRVSQDENAFPHSTPVRPDPPQCSSRRSSEKPPQRFFSQESGQQPRALERSSPQSFKAKTAPAQAAPASDLDKPPTVQLSRGTNLPASYACQDTGTSLSSQNHNLLGRILNLPSRLNDEAGYNSTAATFASKPPRGNHLRVSGTDDRRLAQLERELSMAAESGTPGSHVSSTAQSCTSPGGPVRQSGLFASHSGMLTSQGPPSAPRQSVPMRSSFHSSSSISLHETYAPQPSTAPRDDDSATCNRIPPDYHHQVELTRHDICVHISYI